MTDKWIMEDNYNRVVEALDYAYENLRKAESILRSDLIIDNSGYCADNIRERKTKIYNYRQDVKNRILPAIRNL